MSDVKSFTEPTFSNSFLKLNQFIQSGGQSFKVRLVTKSKKEANDFMTRNPETSLIDEDENGLLWIVNLKEEC